MKRMYRVSLLFCLYGFFKEFRPIEAYLTLYLVNDKGFTNTQTAEEIYPVWTYAQLVALALVGVFTELVGYKPVIVLEALCYAVTGSLLIWGQSLASMQAMQAVYAVATATTIVFYAYAYCLVTPSEFQRVTSYLVFATTFGSMISFLVAQLMYSVLHLSLVWVNVASLCGSIVAIVFALLLPNASQQLPHVSDLQRNGASLLSFASHYSPYTPPPPPPMSPLPHEETSQEALLRVDNENPALQLADAEVRCGEDHGGACIRSEVTLREVVGGTRCASHDDVSCASNESLHTIIAAHDDIISPQQSLLRVDGYHASAAMARFPPFQLALIVTVVASWSLLRWVAWAVLAGAGDGLIGNYVQNLWEEIDPNAAFNGGALAISTLLGSTTAILPSLIESAIEKSGEAILCLASVVITILLMIMSLTNQIWVAYTTYIIYRGVFAFLEAMAAAQIAIRMVSPRYALIFGTNMFFSAVIQTVVTAVITALSLSQQMRFLVFSGYYSFIAVCSIIAAAVMLFLNRRDKSKFT